LIWIFLPYYVRSGIIHNAAVPRASLQRRLRTIFAASLIVGYVAAILAARLYAGALSLQSMLNMT